MKNALTDKVNDREMYMKGIDYSYFYEGYSLYKTSELIKKAVLAWDPNFTKLTATERKELEEAENDPEYINHEDINWD